MELKNAQGKKPKQMLRSLEKMGISNSDKSAQSLDYSDVSSKGNDNWNLGLNKNNLVNIKQTRNN